MKDTEKYLIHVTIAADGVVERSDVVGAVFGQTEGLLGDELDLRDLQESSRVGRIDVSVESENGQSFGEVTVASSLDKVETAILGAAFETIDRIGPCHASVEVTSIEDVRAAKRRQVVERAKELVAGGFEETSLGSTDVLEEVRDAARVEGIVDYDGLPAGPRVGDSDAVIVVEGRADVLALLDCGIKNAVAVEGTNVPDAVADLTVDRTVTAFLDGDRGGELILRELAQVGDVDYVAFAPAGESVEDLDRDAVFEALRGKVPYASLADAADVRAAAGGTERDDTEPTVERDAPRRTEGDGGGVTEAVTRGDVVESLGDEADDPAAETEVADGDEGEATAEVADGDEGEAGTDADRDADSDAADDDEPRSMAAHVRAVVGGHTGRARLLDDEFDLIAEVDAADAVDAVDDAAVAPHAVVVDGDVGQRLLDAAVRRDVTDIVGRGRGEFVKRPVGTRVLTAADLRAGS